MPTGGGEGRGHIVSPRAQLVDLDFCAKIRTFVFVFLDGINNYSVLLCYCSVCFTLKKNKISIFLRPFLHCFRVYSKLCIFCISDCPAFACPELSLLHFHVLQFDPPTSNLEFSGPAFSAPHGAENDHPPLTLPRQVNAGGSLLARYDTVIYSRFEALLKMLHNDYNICSSSLKFIRQSVNEL